MKLLLTEPRSREQLREVDRPESREALFEFVGFPPTSAQAPAMVGDLSPVANVCEADYLREASRTPANQRDTASVTTVEVDPVHSECQDMPPINVTAERDYFEDVASSLCEQTIWCHSGTSWDTYSGTESVISGGGAWSPLGEWLEAAELAAFWSKWAHDSLLNHGLRGTACEGWLPELKTRSMMEDLLTNSDTRRHYLREPGTNPDVAQYQAELWISDNLDAARSAFEWENFGDVIMYLGRAMHTLMDKTSPAHVDEYGWPKEYPGEGHSLTDWFGTERTRDILPGVLDANRANLRAACSFVTGT